ncbi:MAG: UDP-2,4-diacetamido-2,4,6-trideoxy-beta-L-altropyranose hydrolase [Proteobacteria bacterium]|nr:UDP-2,4-diacetamido-2,4,6-trideoxy-beta-L-altropyranose hydrolase [Pseudomonadota bacterium]
MNRFGRTNLTIAMRCDASSFIGSGHVMRTLTLADELSRQGSTVVFVCKRQEGNPYSVITERGYPVEEIENDEEWIARKCPLLGLPEGVLPEILLVDNYGIDRELEAKFRPFFNKIAVIDDLNDRVHDCDLLIDPNFHGADFLNSNKVRVLGNPRKLIGPEYALLRRQFTEGRQKQQLTPTIEKSVVLSPLIFFGGTDPRGDTLRFLQAYEQALKNTKNSQNVTPHLLLSQSLADKSEILDLAARTGVVTVINPKNVADVMEKCDFYLGSGGTVTYERMSLGLTGWVISVASNQDEISAALAEVGAQYFLGSSEDVNYLELCQNLLRGVTVPHQMREICLKLVDGKGAERVAEQLLLLGKNRILFVSPFSGILPHSISDFRVARVLQQDGFQIDYLSCGAVLSEFCVSMSAAGLERTSSENEKKTACKVCQKCSDVLSKPFNRKWLLSSEHSKVVSEYQRFLSRFTKEDFYHYRYQGIEVGKYASYESLLKYKKKSLQFSDDEYRDVALNVQQCIQMIETLSQLQEEIGGWESAVVYNSYYGVNAVAREFLKMRGVKVFSIHAGPNLSYFYDSLLVAREHNLNYYLDLKAKWDAADGPPVSLREKKMLDQHEHARELSEIFKQMPANAAVNWPEDNISLYELLLQSHVLVSAWSSVAKEATLLGLPALSYMSKPLLFPSSLIHVGKDENEYHKKLRELCDKGWSLEKAIGMMRWLVSEQIREVVFVGRHLFQNRSFLLRAIEKVIRTISIKWYVKWLTVKPRGIDRQKIELLFSGDSQRKLSAPQEKTDVQDTSKDYQTLVQLRAKLIERIISNSDSEVLNSWRDPIASK